jgi:large subunit ribosomal protein L22
MKASLQNYRQSPRKVRLLADLVRGKTVSEALNVLAVTPKRASEGMVKLINSAAANAKTSAKSPDVNLSNDSLVIEMVQVNKGVTLKRMLPRARGNASRINKRSSNVTISLGVKKAKPAKSATKTSKITKK